MTVSGIDVSAFQGDFNWGAHQDIAFAGIRATSWTKAGLAADTELARNAQRTWDLYDGKVVRIYYHESMTAASDPDVQAATFLRRVGGHLCRGDVLAVAMGDTGGNGSMSPAQIAAWHAEMLHHLRLLTERAHRVIAYCNVSWAQGGNCHGLGGWGLWLASYDIAEPVVPGPWSKRDLVLWQKSGTGLDQDEYMQGDRRALNGWAGMPGYRL